MMMPLVGAGAACALIGFPKTKLVDDSPLIGAGECHVTVQWYARACWAWAWGPRFVLPTAVGLVPVDWKRARALGRGAGDMTCSCFLLG